VVVEVDGGGGGGAAAGGVEEEEGRRRWWLRRSGMMGRPVLCPTTYVSENVSENGEESGEESGEVSEADELFKTDKLKRCIFFLCHFLWRPAATVPPASGSPNQR